MQGALQKMHITLKQGKAEYALRLDEHLVPLNPFLAQTLHLEFCTEKRCIECGRLVVKTFQQGYCFPCTQKLAMCDLCFVQPHRCHFHLNTCREPEWAQQHCMQDHIVYLANTSGLKVGITRASQIPTRWLDQGAVAALPVFKVKTRRVAGLIEHALTQKISGTTQWRALLQGEPIARDLKMERAQLLEWAGPTLDHLQLTFGLDSFQILNAEPVDIIYPILTYPQKVQTLEFDKTPEISGTLMGIKGQYLIFDRGVLNVRKFTGYTIRMLESPTTNSTIETP